MLSVLCTGLLLPGMLSALTAAADWKSDYCDTIDEAYQDDRNTRFALLYVDDDPIPELLLSHSESGYNTYSYQLYTMREGQAVRVWKSAYVYGKFACQERTGQFLDSFTANGTSAVTIYALSDGAAAELDSRIWNQDGSGDGLPTGFFEQWHVNNFAVPQEPWRTQTYADMAQADGETVWAAVYALPDAYADGDLNGDGTPDASDAAQILTAAARIGADAPSGLTAAGWMAADLNADGDVNASDAALLLQYSAAAGAGAKVTVERFLCDHGARLMPPEKTWISEPFERPGRGTYCRLSWDPVPGARWYQLLYQGGDYMFQEPYFDFPVRTSDGSPCMILSMTVGDNARLYSRWSGPIPLSVNQE